MFDTITPKNPQVWGPPLWNFLHILSFSYPQNPTLEQQQDMRNFFLSLHKVLCCKPCKFSFGGKLNRTEFNDALESRKNLKVWLLKIHNEVNKYNNKPIYTMQQLEKDIHSKCEECSSSNEKGIFCFNNILMGVAIVAAVVVCTFYYTKRH